LKAKSTLVPEKIPDERSEVHLRTDLPKPFPLLKLKGGFQEKKERGGWGGGQTTTTNGAASTSRKPQKKNKNAEFFFLPISGRKVKVRFV